MKRTIIWSSGWTGIPPWYPATDCRVPLVAMLILFQISFCSLGRKSKIQKLPNIVGGRHFLWYRFENCYLTGTHFRQRWHRDCQLAQEDRISGTRRTVIKTNSTLPLSLTTRFVRFVFDFTTIDLDLARLVRVSVSNTFTSVGSGTRWLKFYICNVYGTQHCGYPRPRLLVYCSHCFIVLVVLRIFFRELQLNCPSWE